MQITTYIEQRTAKSFEELFSPSAPLVRLEQTSDGPISIAYWDSSLGAQPTADDIATALTADEPVPVPLSVSSRQFRSQLLAQSILDQVDTYITTQSKAVQIAYEYSGTFVRSEPMMAKGFKAMNFTDDQIDAFFVAASKL